MNTIWTSTLNTAAAMALALGSAGAQAARLDARQQAEPNALKGLLGNECVHPAGLFGCHTSIQDALDVVGTGKTVNVFPGTYYENLTIDTDGVTLRSVGLLGADRVIVDGRGQPGTGTSPDPCDTLPHHTIHVDADNVTIKKLTVRHACKDNIRSVGDSTTLDHVRSISAMDYGVEIYGDFATVKNSRLAANRNGIYVEGTDATVHKVVVESSNEDGIDIDGSNATVTDNQVDNVNDESCIYLENAAGALVTRNVVKGCDGYGIEAYDGDADTHIRNNDLSNLYENGIYIDGGSGVEISNNLITNVEEYGIEAYLDDSDISGNRISATGSYGIYGDEYGADGGDNRYADNRIQDISDDGIDVYGIGFTVSGNRILNALYYGIYCDTTCDDSTISDNIIEQLADDGEGIYLSSTTNVTLTGNSVSYTADNGYTLNNVDDSTIADNSASVCGSAEYEGGYDIDGSGNEISNNLAEMSAYFGFYVEGPNTLSSNIARNGYGEGIYIDGTDAGTLNLMGNRVRNNQGDGIANTATDGTVNVTDNTATGNRLDICDNQAGSTANYSGNTFNSGGPTTPCDFDM